MSLTSAVLQETHISCVVSGTRDAPFPLFTLVHKCKIPPNSDKASTLTFNYGEYQLDSVIQCHKARRSQLSLSLHFFCCLISQQALKYLPAWTFRYFRQEHHSTRQRLVACQIFCNHLLHIFFSQLGAWLPYNISSRLFIFVLSPARYANYSTVCNIRMS